MGVFFNDSARKSLLHSSVFTRIIASVVFIPCLIVVTLKGGYHFLALMDVVIFIGVWEFYRMMEAKGMRPYKGIGVFCSLALSWYFFFRHGMYANFFLTLVLLAVMCLELTRKDGRMAVYHISTTIVGVIYISFLGSHLILLRELPISLNIDYGYGSSFVFLAFIMTWAGDTGAYIVGVLAGKRLLLPRISEKKTKEGSIGGIVFSLTAAVVARYTFASYLETWQALLMGLIAAIAGQLGDLVESMIKRDAAIKDASATIPGHGGVLDRFDSLLFTSPLIYYLLKFMIFE